MLKRAHSYVLAVLVVMLLPISVFANEIEVVETKYLDIPISVYNNLRKLYSENYIYLMTEADYERIMNLNLNYDSVQTKEKFIKTTYNNITGEIINQEVTEEEYNVDSTVMPMTLEYETQYKKVMLTLLEETEGYAYFIFTNQWKRLPSVRSFDVIGARLDNFRVLNGTQQGKQIYMLDDEVDYVQYNFNGTNIKNLDDGFGISMNLLNSEVQALECTIDSTLIIDAYPAFISGSYQHAVRNVTLSQSQDYYIAPGGMGDVFYFNNGVGSYYDDTMGLYDYFTTP